MAWKDREAGLAARTADAQALVGKTVAKAHVEPHQDSCDGENRLVLTMTDGTVFDIEGSYGGYTGNSCDEYFEYVEISEREVEASDD